MAPESKEYEVLEKIGHGSFGIIRKVRRVTDGLVMCRKEISYLRMSQKEREQLHAEFQILSHLRHPNIVGYYHREHLKATQDLHLYMEYCGNGDLGRVIRDLIKSKTFAQESFVWSIFSQLVTALYRCHYGVDPPEVGANVLGLYGNATKPKTPAGTMTILHRDLKPENVFLGEDNSVKLGDFGLSKMIHAHDFASTYVGTPFYMSPEICAAEKYTLKSDIWSLGCIIYELCAKEPPFNANSHFALVQKIKEGKVAPLPDVYSPELMQVIKDCLKINPDRRPDTAALLNLPIVRLMRKEKEVVDLNKALRIREEALAAREKAAEARLAALDADKANVRQELDSSLRREWELKARLEIDRQVKLELEQLHKRFDAELNARLAAELQKKTVSFAEHDRASGGEEPVDDSLNLSKSDYPYSSIGAASADGDFPSTTDITELSVDDSPVPPVRSKSGAPHPTRTPFGRAQTMFVGPAAGMGTPMDVEMMSPSPIPSSAVAGLALSPRRNAGTKAPSTNQALLFPARPGSTDPKWDVPRDARGGAATPDSDDDDDDVFPSPTRQARSNRNPFTSKTRPVLQSQKSAPLNRIKTQLSTGNLLGKPRSEGQVPTVAASKEQQRSASPNRRLSKIPSAANLGVPSLGEPTAPGLTRKPSVGKKDGGVGGAAGDLGKLAAKNNVRGRTLIELQQARAGGRPLSGLGGLGGVPASGPENVSPKRAFRDRVAETKEVGAGAGATAGSDEAAVWDPERDEMPSPFLVRKRQLNRS